MPIRCDNCGEEATVHELRVVAGKKVEKHLCERCARKQGIATAPAVSVPELIEKYLQAATSKPVEEGMTRSTSACPTCATSYLEFRQSGLLGCHDCYRAFEVQLGPLLERAHESGTHHVGKLPRRALTGAAKAKPGPARGVEQGGIEAILGGPAELAGRLTTLRRQLGEAISAEQYERAAQLRDDIQKLEQLRQASPEGGGTSR
jgi:protein arginine kinase activator